MNELKPCTQHVRYTFQPLKQLRIPILLISKLKQLEIALLEPFSLSYISCSQHRLVDTLKLKYPNSSDYADSVMSAKLGWDLETRTYFGTDNPHVLPSDLVRPSLNPTSTLLETPSLPH